MTVKKEERVANPHGDDISKQINVRKISTKLLCPKVKKEPEGYLYTVIGNAVGKKDGQSLYGSWVAFTGTFEAWNREKSFRSNMCFLPQLASLPIEVALTGDDKAVSFAFEVHKKNTDTGVDYEYLIKTLLPNTTTDVLKELKDQLDTV